MTATKLTELDEARAALAWWIDAGVDVEVADRPTPWLRTRAEALAAPTPSTYEARVPIARAPAPERPANTDTMASGSQATELANAATDVPALAAAMRTHAGPGALLLDGNTASGLLFVTDAPSFDDEREGRLFVGYAGALLDRMLAAIGLDRARAGLATIALTPHGGAEQIAFLHRLLALEKPRMLVALGGPATVRLTQATHGLNRLRGKWLETFKDGMKFPVLPTFHPAHLLANPAHKALAWADLLVLRSRLAN